jgi:HAD superfamily hydrolase (TIGR01484 family)
MKYKALIMDIDGTCVPNALDAVPSETVRNAIALARKKIPVCAATGRPLSIAKRVIRELGITDYCATSDATVIYHPETDRVVRSFPLRSDAAEAVKAHLIKRNVRFMVGEEQKEDIYRGNALPNPTHSLAVPELSNDQADDLVQSLTHIPNISVMKVKSFIPNNVWVTITHAEATKLHGVMVITELLGIDPAEVIGVGDGYNDYPLLSACGLKIAMGNAVPELKAIADFIAPSVDEDGVATVIEKFILG